MTLSQSFKVTATHKSFYSGGQIEIIESADEVVGLCDSGISVFDTVNGKVVASFEQSGDSFNTFAVDKSRKRSYVTAGNSLLFRHWLLDEDASNPVRSWGGHDQVVSSIDIDSTGTYMVSGSMDKTVKVWSLSGYYCTHNFRGHSAAVTAVRFQPHEQRVISVSQDFEVKVWCLATHKCLATFKDHLATINTLAFMNTTLITAGNDQILNFWDLQQMRLARQLPVFEAVTSIAVRDDLIATVGEKGLIRIWRDSACIASAASSDAHALNGQLSHVFFTTTGLYTVGADLSLAQWSNELQVQKQWLGSVGEVVSVKYLDSNRLLCGTNDENPRLLNLTDGTAKSLVGHSALILCTAVGPNGLIATGGKDQKVIIWNSETCSKVEELTGHTGSVTGLSFSRGKLGKSPRLFTASEDRTFKIWDLSTWKSELSAVAHKKGVNDISIAPNEKLFATAGQDKEAKIWCALTGKLLGSCTGHRRGVWSVAFSPTERVLASASGDTTVKLWNLVDFACLRTFQGHELSALTVRFMPSGMQLLSAGGDGTLRLWNIRTSENIFTSLDIHDDKIWSFDLCGTSLVTGGADGKINCLEDNTREVTELAANEKADGLIKDTRIGRLLGERNYSAALRLAFELNRPGQMITIMETAGWSKLSNPEDEGVDLSSFVASLEQSEENLGRLMDVISRWISTARFSHLAQELASHLFKSVPLSLLKDVEGYKNFLETFTSYSQRHMNRVETFSQRVFVFDAILQASNKSAVALVETVDALDDFIDQVPDAKRAKVAA